MPLAPVPLRYGEADFDSPIAEAGGTLPGLDVEAMLVGMCGYGVEQASQAA
jgi:hypothetical protein